MNLVLAGLAGTAALLLVAACSADEDSPAAAERSPAPAAASATPVAPAMPETRPDTLSGVEQVVAFADPAHCTPAPALVSLLGRAAPLDALGRPVKSHAGLAPQIDGAEVGTPVIGSEGSTHTLDLPLAAPWHGLHLVGISQVWTEQSDHAELSLRFAEPAAQTIAALNRQGFDLAPDGRRTQEGEVMATYLAVTPDGSGARLTCSAG